MRETADFSNEDMASFQNPEDAKGVYARFYYRPVRDEAASAAAGLPCFVDQEYVEIMAAGNSNNVVVHKVGDIDKRRFRQAYDKFKEGDVEQLVGMPLKEVPWLTMSQIEELAYAKVRTLEQLAEVNDAVCNSRPGLYDLKRRAKSWIEKAEGAAPFTALHAENDALKARLQVMEEALAEIAAAKAKDKK